MQNNDVYTISGRIKNLIAMKDLGLSPAGTVLVNTFTLLLQDLYNFADTLSDHDQTRLNAILAEKEKFPAYVLEVITPKQDPEDEYPIQDSEPEFDSAQEALDFFTKEFDALGKEYGKTGEEFWQEAESSSTNTDDYSKIRELSRNIAMAKDLIKQGC